MGASPSSGSLALSARRSIVNPVNKGVLCAKGSAGIMNHYSPARLSKPLRRVGPRGSGEYQEIEWEEAMATATDWLGAIRRTDPRKLAFFTGRDQSQALTGWWASQFGTPNHAAHGAVASGSEPHASGYAPCHSSGPSRRRSAARSAFSTHTCR